MGIDKRGVFRGKCTEWECDCEEYEQPRRGHDCEYCACKPAKHEVGAEVAEVGNPEKKRRITTENKDLEEKEERRHLDKEKPDDDHEPLEDECIEEANIQDGEKQGLHNQQHQQYEPEQFNDGLCEEVIVGDETEITRTADSVEAGNANGESIESGPGIPEPGKYASCQFNLIKY